MGYPNDIDHMPAGTAMDELIVKLLWTNNGIAVMEIWPLSTDATSAMRVHDEMHKRGLWLKINSSFFKEDYPEVGYVAQWYGGYTPHGVTGWNGRPDFAATGDTLPLVICRSAYRVLVNNPTL